MATDTTRTDLTAWREKAERIALAGLGLSPVEDDPYTLKVAAPEPGTVQATGQRSTSWEVYLGGRLIGAVLQIHPNGIAGSLTAYTPKGEDVVTFENVDVVSYSDLRKMAQTLAEDDLRGRLVFDLTETGK